MNKEFFKITLSCLSLSLFSQGVHAEKAGQCPTPEEVMINIANITIEGRDFKSVQTDHLQGKLTHAHIALISKNKAILSCAYSIKDGNNRIPNNITIYKSEFICDGEDAISFRTHTQAPWCDKNEDLVKNCPVFCAINDVM
jgi:pectate lyase